MEADPEKLTQLMGFGFEESKARLALIVADGDLELAASLAVEKTEDELTEMLADLEAPEEDEMRDPVSLAN